MAKNIKDPELYKISAKNWIDPKEFARSKGVAKSDSPTKRVATPKITGYEKPTASISPYNAGLKLSPAQQAQLEKDLRNRKMLENVQLGLGAAEALGAVPLPITEGLGLGAGLLNAGLSSYLAGQDYSSGNYGGMAGNLLGAGLSGVGAAALAPKKVTDIVNTAAKSKNLKELGAYALKGVPPEKSLGRLGKADLKAMRQVQEVQRRTPNEYDKYLQAALDENIPDIHFEKAFGKTKSEAQDLIKDRAAQRAAYEQQVAERQAQEAQRLADLQAANAGNVQTQAMEDIDVNDIDWSQFDESNDSMYDYDTDLPESDLDLDDAANQLASPPDTIYTDTSSRDFNFDIAPYRAPDGFEQDASGIYRNQYGETVAEENARLDQEYFDYVANQRANRSSNFARTFLPSVNLQVIANPDRAIREVKQAVTNSGITNELDRNLTEILQDYPYYGGSDIHYTNRNEFLSNIGSKKGFAERVNRGISSAEKIPSGQVFTGSLDTSHNSYLPQLKKVFKEGINEGDPTFLGYTPMNTHGYLSQGSYTPKEIAAYLNTEIDDQIRRNIVPKNIQRPYVKDEEILLPQYGITKKKNGGFLEKYDDGGPVQPNYNDYSVSAPEGYVGDGYSNEGRNYSPAWGGQFAMGGSLPGSVGFMYARTQDPAPSEGPYAKKTMPSAQDGIVAKTDATRVAAPALKLTKAQLDKNKAINKQVMANTEKANAIKLAERKKGMAESSDASIINPNGKRFAIGDKLRLFPNDIGGVGEILDDYFNPAVFVGDTASGLGNAMIDRDPAALAIETGMALGTGALGFDPLGDILNTKLKFKAPENLNLVRSSMNPFEGINNKYQNTRANIARLTNSLDIQDALHDYTHNADMRARAQGLVNRIGAQQAPTVTPSVPPVAPTGNIFEQKGLNFLQNPIDPVTNQRVSESFLHPSDQKIEMLGNPFEGVMEVSIYDNPLNLRHGEKIGNLRAEVRHPGTPGYPSSWPQEMPALTDFNFFNEGPSAAKQLQILMQGIEGKPVYLPGPGSVSMHSQPLMTQTLARYASQKNLEGLARARVMPKLDYAGNVEMSPLNKITRGDLSVSNFNSPDVTNQVLEQLPKIQKSITSLNNADRRLNLPPAQMMYKNQPIDLDYLRQNPFKSFQDYYHDFKILHPQYSAIKRWREGGELTKLDQLTNFTNYNTKQPGGWLDKYES